MWLISCDFPPGHFSLDFPHFLDCRRLPHPRETNNTYHTHLWATIPRRGRLVLTAMRRLVLVVRPLWIFPNLYNRCQHSQHFQIVFHSDTHKAWDCTSTGDLIICPTSCRFQPALCSDNTIPIIYTYLYSCFRSHDSSILQPFVPSRPWQVHKVCTILLICDISIYI